MRLEICSRQAVLALFAHAFPKNAAVISFYTPHKSERVDYVGVCERVFYVPVPDIDRRLLGAYGYTEESYLAEADALAAFIDRAVAEGVPIVCQCDFGQSRSAACAAAILQHFEGRGIDVFADERYYPNQLVYHKVYAALAKRKREGK